MRKVFLAGFACCRPFFLPVPVTLVFCAALAISCSRGEKAPLPARVIFDTDMGPDYDDVGALAILHTLADAGRCEILATVSSDGHPGTAPVLELINAYLGRPGIPVGMPDAGAPGFIAPNHWNDSLLAAFPRPGREAVRTYPRAVMVYRSVLAQAPDTSVTLVSVGFLSNLAALLQSGPDAASPLSGAALVRQKVRRWVAMAGEFPEGGEFNVRTDSLASKYAIDNWPTEIVFCGVKIGWPLLTGGRLAAKSPDTNPLAWAYRYNLATYEKEVKEGRPSWDQATVLAALDKGEAYFYRNGPGTVTVSGAGYTTWHPDPAGRHYFLTHKHPYGHMAGIIDRLMAGELE